MEQGRERKKRRKKKKKKKEKEDKVKNKVWNPLFWVFWYEFPWRIDAPWSRVLEEIT